MPRVGRSGADASCVMARTESGLVCGARKEASNGAPFASFLGVPYAKAPLGALRFAEPQNPDPFTGVFNATLPGPVCPQMTSSFVAIFLRPHSMSEDCLRANVHSPLESVPDLEAKESRPLLPVLVFIHGGSFADGSGDSDVYGPEYLMSTGIVMVTFNFRIGAIGFLTLNSKYIPGNAGLRDALFALKWVQRNIKNFGGDPKRVTLGGLSSGANMAHILSISPATKGLSLFKRLILMSSNSLSNTYTPYPLKAQLIGNLFVAAMGINLLQSPEKIHEQLTQAPIEKILNAYLIVKNTTKSGVNFVPAVETAQKGFTTVLSKNPEDLLKEGRGKEYPILFGYTNSECGIYKYVIKKILPMFGLLPFINIPQNLLFYNIWKMPLLTKMISKEYFNSTYPTMKSFVPYCTDSNFKYPTLRAIDARLAVGAAPSFIYQFSYVYDGEDPLKETLGGNWTGVAHSQDAGYVFRVNSNYPPIKEDELNQNNTFSNMKRFLTNAFANFVKFGHPGANLSDWKPCGHDYSFMDIVEPEPQYQPATPYMLDKKRFFDTLYKVGLS